MILRFLSFFMNIISLSKFSVTVFINWYNIIGIFFVFYVSALHHS